jgi:hypothetical protein
MSSPPAADAQAVDLRAPENGLWRVARGPDPLAHQAPLSQAELDSARVGNRFDSPIGDYGVLYFGTLLESCFGETLARLRPSPALAALANAEWAENNFMPPGAVPAEWRQRRLAVRVRAPRTARFLDVEDANTHRALERSLGSILAASGRTGLDVAAIRGGDRRLTRLISYWAHQQRDDKGLHRYAGVRYLSRLSTAWECWAVFDRLPLDEIERRPIAREDPALSSVAKHFSLRVF